MRSLLLLLVITFSAYCNPTSCAAVCTFSLRQSLSSFISDKTALLAPFHYIMKTEIDSSVVYKKAKWTCFATIQFDACLKKCPTTFEKSALLTSLSHWNAYCTLLRKPNHAVLNFFTCERDHLFKVESKCGNLAFQPNQKLNQMCRGLENFRKCYAEQAHNCTADALQIKERIDDAIMLTTERLLKMNSNRVRIPRKCSAWRRHRLRQHENYNNNDDEDEDVKESSGSDDLVKPTFVIEIRHPITTTIESESITTPATSQKLETSTSPGVEIEEPGSEEKSKVEDTITEESQEQYFHSRKEAEHLKQVPEEHKDKTDNEKDYDEKNTDKPRIPEQGIPTILSLPTEDTYDIPIEENNNNPVDEDSLSYDKTEKLTSGEHLFEIIREPTTTSIPTIAEVRASVPLRIRYRETGWNNNEDPVTYHQPLSSMSLNSEKESEEDNEAASILSPSSHFRPRWAGDIPSTASTTTPKYSIARSSVNSHISLFYNVLITFIVANVIF